MQNIAFYQVFIRFSAGNGDLIYTSQISRYNSSNDILPTSVAMWVFKTADASMKGSQVGNRSAGQLGGTAGYGSLMGGTDLQNVTVSLRLILFFAGNGDLTSGNGFTEYCILAMFYKHFRGERGPNGGERICRILHFNTVL